MKSHAALRRVHVSARVQDLSASRSLTGNTRGGVRYYDSELDLEDPLLFSRFNNTWDSEVLQICIRQILQSPSYQHLLLTCLPEVVVFIFSREPYKHSSGAPGAIAPCHATHGILFRKKKTRRGPSWRTNVIRRRQEIYWGPTSWVRVVPVSTQCGYGTSERLLKLEPN